MQLPLEFTIGLRYTRAKRRSYFISFISLISVLGIFLGVSALIIVMSVMNGFETEFRDRLLGLAAHATISSYDDAVPDWQTVVEQASEQPHVLGAAPYVTAEAMFTHGSAVRGAVVRGVLPDYEPRVSQIREKMLHGSLDDLVAGEYNVILGSELARALGVFPGDKVTLVAPQASVTPAGILPRLRRFTVSGLFEIGAREYDAGLALVSMADAQRLYRLDDRVSGIRLRLDDMFSAPRVSRELADRLPGNYWVTDWTQQHSNYYKAVRTEKTMMFIILALVVAVAAFNIVSTLFMVVMEKQSDIAILRTLGLSPPKVMSIFIVQGTLIGLVGILLGTVSGVLVALNLEPIVAAIEALFHVKFLSPDIYYISDIPSEMRWRDVVATDLIAFLLTLLATLYPAWRGSRTAPAEALRYE